MAKYNIAIVDDHKLFRKGLTRILTELGVAEKITEYGDGQEFIDSLAENHDLALMDIKMPNMDGIDTTRKALKERPDLKIIALSMFHEKQYYVQMVDAGVNGFLLKDIDEDELEVAIQSVMNGRNYFSQKLLIKLLKNSDEPDMKKPLTHRENEVLQLICKGLSNQEMSEVLNLSPRTVERHRANILTKTECKNTVSLVMFAIKHKLITLDL